MNLDELLAQAKIPTDQSSITINIDQICDIARQTVLSVKGALGMVLWCWTVRSHTSLDLNRQATTTWVSVGWLVLVLFGHILYRINRKLVDGWGKYQLNPQSDVVLVTGGSNGLGLVVMAMFSANGFRTVCLDLSPPALAVANSQFVRCDISSGEAIEKSFSQLKSTPTVLIHCAGTVKNTLGAITSIEPESITKLVQTNYLGTILLVRAFLRQNPQAKMVTAISSSTALATPAFAAAYSSSKAGVHAFLTALRYELAATPGNRARVLCVLPGQLDTAMFQDLETPSEFFAPVLRAVDVGTEIYKAVMAGRQGDLAMPFYSLMMPFALTLPVSVLKWFRWLSGMDVAAWNKKTVEER